MSFDFLNSFLLGFGLAIDAFSVSVADAISEAKMEKRKKVLIAFNFASFQFFMPLLGWILLRTANSYFSFLNSIIPYIAFILLVYIGIKMIVETKKEDQIQITSNKTLNYKTILMQGIATSIDALSVGFTTSHYNLKEALLTSLIIGIVTFILCFSGLWLGKKIGEKVEKKASILGGSVLIFLGLEFLIKTIVVS